MKKHLIVIGTSVLLLVVGLSGCVSPEQELYGEIRNRIRITEDVIDIESFEYATIEKYSGDDFYTIHVDYTAWDYDMSHDEIIKDDSYDAKAKKINGEWEIRVCRGDARKFYSSWDIVDADPFLLPQTFYLDYDNPCTPLFIITNESDTVQFKITFNRKTIDEDYFGNRMLYSLIYTESGSYYNLPSLPILEFKWDDKELSKKVWTKFDVVDGYSASDEINPGIYYISTSAPSALMNNEDLSWIISIG